MPVSRKHRGRSFSILQKVLGDYVKVGEFRFLVSGARIGLAHYADIIHRSSCMVASSFPSLS